VRRSLLPLLLLAALVVAGCGQDGPTSAAPGTQEAAFPVTIDSPGGKVALARRPERIVSMSPTATEMLFAIGAGGQVVAADSNSNYPPEAPKTDLSAYQPNVEAIAGYKPDLVVYSDDPGELAASLGRLGVPALAQPAATRLDDTYAQLDQLGKATGHAAERGS
jgi:iron complex transport system substrate-binding protein